VSESLGLKLQNASIAQLGSAKRIVASKHRTTIIGGAGRSMETPYKFAASSRRRLTTNDYDREKLQERKIAEIPQSTPGLRSTRGWMQAGRNMAMTEAGIIDPSEGRSRRGLRAAAPPPQGRTRDRAAGAFRNAPPASP
jgi:hypothetical protein